MMMKHLALASLAAALIPSSGKAATMEDFKSQELRLNAAPVLAAAAEFRENREEKTGPATKGSITLDVPNPLELSFTIPDHGGKHFTYDGRVWHGDDEGDSLVITNLSFDKVPEGAAKKSVTLKAEEKEKKTLTLVLEGDKADSKGLLIKEGENKIEITIEENDHAITTETFIIKVTVDWRY